MTDKAEPALSAEEWANREYEDVPETHEGARLSDGGHCEILYDSGCAYLEIARPAALIAITNAALPDSDPRKITRERLLNVKKGMDVWFGAIAATGDPEDRRPWEDAIKFLAALESYLPPDPA